MLCKGGKCSAVRVDRGRNAQDAFGVSCDVVETSEMEIGCFAQMIGAQILDCEWWELSGVFARREGRESGTGLG